MASPFSGLPVADIAQRRLAQINLEFKAKETATTVKLGTYEQNIGLKYGVPRPKSACPAFAVEAIPPALLRQIFSPMALELV